MWFDSTRAPPYFAKEHSHGTVSILGVVSVWPVGPNRYHTIKKKSTSLPQAKMTARVILNPYSGRYTGRKRWPEAQEALDAAGFAYKLSSTERPGHARELARDAVLAGFSPIIAAGGDGTVSEVVNGLA